MTCDLLGHIMSWLSAHTVMFQVTNVLASALQINPKKSPNPNSPQWHPPNNPRTWKLEDRKLKAILGYIARFWTVCLQENLLKDKPKASKFTL